MAAQTTQPQAASASTPTPGIQVAPSQGKEEKY